MKTNFDLAFGSVDGGFGARLPDGLSRDSDCGAFAKTDDGATRHVLILGGSLLQLPAIRMAKDEGWKVILADGSDSVPGRGFCDYFEHVDLKDKDAMLSMARRYFGEGRLHGVFTAATDFSATVAWVAENLGLPGIPYEVALNASSKLRMRRIFAEKGIPSPAFQALDDGQDTDKESVRRLKLPLVVKPIDNMGARGVRKVRSWDELDEAILQARRFARAGTIIVEEFIEGPEYSIDSLVFDGRLYPCGIAERHVEFPPYFVETGHTIPSELEGQKLARFVAVFAEAVAALGIRNGAAKGDVFFGPDGPVIGEIAARLSGGYMSGWTFPLSSGLELTRAALRIAMGLPVPSLEPRVMHTAAERAIISIDGTVESVEGLAEAAKLPLVRNIFMRAGPGNAVVFPRNNVEKAGNIIASDPDREAAMRAAQTAVSRVLPRLRPAGKETIDFLLSDSGPIAFPEFYPRVLAAWDAAGDFVWDSFLASLPGPVLEGRDWSWRSLRESTLRISSPEKLSAAESLGLAYCLAKGGLQGAVFFVDTLRSLSESQGRDFVSAFVAKVER